MDTNKLNNAASDTLSADFNTEPAQAATMSPNSKQPSSKSQSSNIKRFAPLAIIIAAVIAFFASGAAESLSFENLTQSYLDARSMIEANLVVSMAVFIGAYILLVAIAFPATWVLTVGGGLVFGTLLGTVGTVVGATLGAIILYWVAREALSDFFEARAGKLFQKFKQGFLEDEVSYMLFLRLVPFPFLVVNTAPGILKVRFITYVWTTLIGILPGSFAYALAGAGLASSIDGQFDAFSQCQAQGHDNCALIDPSAIITTELVLGFAAIGVASLIPVFVKKLRKSKSTT